MRVGTVRRRDHPGALVIGGGHVGLGIVRSLGRNGVQAWALTAENPLAGTSRYCRRRLAWPDGDYGRGRDYLLRLCERHGLGGWALFPTSDESAALIAQHHAALGERFVLTVPPWERYRWAYDKRLTYKLASELGVDHPATYFPVSREDVSSLDCAFPAILKPAVKEGHNAFTSGKAWRVENPQELLALYDAACALVPPEVIMVQELIPAGPEAQYSFAALSLDGRPLAWVVARRTRQYPDAFGVASFVETIEQPAIEAAGRKMLAGLRLTGLVEMDIVQDLRSGLYHVLDVNARAWSWHALGRRAGVDFPYLLWQLVHGQPVAERQGRVGVRWIHLIPDLQGALRDARKGQLRLGEYVRSLAAPAEGAIFALDDPLPGPIEPAVLIGSRLRQRAEGRNRRTSARR